MIKDIRSIPTSWWLAVLLLVSLLIRSSNLGHVPVILNRDEAALAYNALLLKESGQDEWQRRWPLTLESFGDYKLPGYVWLLVGSFSLLGYQDSVVRFPSAIAGTVTVGVVFWLAGHLGLKGKRRLVPAALVAFNPVFVFYSRMAWEANVALVWWLIMLAALLRKADNRQWLWDQVACVVALLAIFTYNTPLLLLPFLIVILPLIRGWRRWQNWWVPVLGLVLVMAVGVLIQMSITSQKSAITLFGDPTTQAQMLAHRQELSGWAQKIWGNKYIFWSQLIGQRLVASFSPTFLVTRGGAHPWHQMPGFGHVSWVAYGLAMIGVGRALWLLAWQLKTNYSQLKVSQWLGLYLLLIGLIPAVITVDAPHATRSLFFLIMFMWFASQGLFWLLKWLPAAWIAQPRGYLVATCCLLVLLFCENVNYLSRYFSSYQAESAKILRGGYTHVLGTTDSQFPEGPIAVVDGGGYQYIITAWYMQLPPAEFFATVVKQLPDRVGLRYGEKLDRYHFIVKAEDRLPTEKIVIEWAEDRQAWVVKQYR